MIGVARAVGRLLEGVVTDAAQRVDEALGSACAQLAVGVQNRLDHARHFGGGKRRANHLARRGGARQGRAVAAAQRDLVPLLAVLVDAQDADVAAVVVAMNDTRVSFE